jgi:hypothetical protein
MSTVETTEAQLAAVLGELAGAAGSSILRQYLAPPGYRPLVRLENRQSQRKLRSTAEAGKAWSAETGAIVISFEPAAAAPAPENSPVADLVRALDRVEARSALDFIALKWFRDTVLPAEDFPWAASDGARGAVLYEATEKGLVLTSRVPNPKQPQHPVTSVRLNRASPEVQEILSAAGPSEFQPVEIKGEPLSHTVLEGRR